MADSRPKTMTKAFIGFCPDLKLYRYMIIKYELELDPTTKLLDYAPKNTEEQRFSDEELISSVAALEKDRKFAEKDYLTLVTALARKQPHMRVEVETQPA